MRFLTLQNEREVANFDQLTTSKIICRSGGWKTTKKKPITTTKLSKENTKAPHTTDRAWPEMGELVRAASHAGSWYTADGACLRRVRHPDSLLSPL